MGMYTEIIIKARIKESIPKEVRKTLEYLFNGDECPSILPVHPFFNLPRWDSIGKCSSFYHIPWADSKYEKDYLFSRSDLKNYDGEIEAFFSWIKQYVNETPETCIGWSWYEENPSPTLIYAADR